MFSTRKPVSTRGASAKPSSRSSSSLASSAACASGRAAPLSQPQRMGSASVSARCSTSRRTGSASAPPYAGLSVIGTSRANSLSIVGAAPLGSTSKPHEQQQLSARGKPPRPTSASTLRNQPSSRDAPSKSSEASAPASQKAVETRWLRSLPKEERRAAAAHSAALGESEHTYPHGASSSEVESSTAFPSTHESIDFGVRNVAALLASSSSGAGRPMVSTSSSRYSHGRGPSAPPAAEQLFSPALALQLETITPEMIDAMERLHVASAESAQREEAIAARARAVVGQRMVASASALDREARKAERRLRALALNP